ncbi:hypothetical protein DIPPA_07891 [Diplonema papillatum]|nr:hypothetical protein DIPPA_07891 [Diplonema papillatum]
MAQLQSRVQGRLQSGWSSYCAVEHTKDYRDVLAQLTATLLNQNKSKEEFQKEVTHYLKPGAFEAFYNMARQEFNAAKKLAKQTDQQHQAKGAAVESFAAGGKLTFRKAGRGSGAGMLPPATIEKKIVSGRGRGEAPEIAIVRNAQPVRFNPLGAGVTMGRGRGSNGGIVATEGKHGKVFQKVPATQTAAAVLSKQGGAKGQGKGTKQFPNQSFRPDQQQQQQQHQQQQQLQLPRPGQLPFTQQQQQQQQQRPSGGKGGKSTSRAGAVPLLTPQPQQLRAQQQQLQQQQLQQQQYLQQQQLLQQQAALVQMRAAQANTQQQQQQIAKLVEAQQQTKTLLEQQQQEQQKLRQQLQQQQHLNVQQQQALAQAQHQLAEQAALFRQQQQQHQHVGMSQQQQQQQQVSQQQHQQQQQQQLQQQQQALLLQQQQQQQQEAAFQQAQAQAQLQAQQGQSVDFLELFQQAQLQLQRSQQPQAAVQGVVIPQTLQQTGIAVGVQPSRGRR